MTAMQRLAIIDRGEPAMRCISAVAELNLASREHITTIALCAQDTASSIVREANEVVLLSPVAFAATGTRLDPVQLLAALNQARADALWAGWEFTRFAWHRVSELADLPLWMIHVAWPRLKSVSKVPGARASAASSSFAALSYSLFPASRTPRVK